MPSIQNFAATELAGLKSAKFGFLHSDLDGLASNINMVSCRRQELIAALGDKKKGPAISVMHGNNPMVNLAENRTTDCFDSSLWVMLSAGSSFMRMGANFLRLIQSVFPLVEREMKLPVLGEPPEAATLTTNELMDYALRNFTASFSNHDDSWSDDEDEAAQSRRARDEGMDEPTQRARSEFRRRKFLYKQAWLAFVAIFNGCIWGAHSSIGPCYSATIPHDLAKLRRQGAIAIVRLLHRTMPVRPVKGKWTKLGVCLDWWLLNLGVMNLMSKLWPCAYSAFMFQVKQVFEGDGEGLVEDFDWHQVRSKRATFIHGCLTEVVTMSITIMCVVLEPLRHLTFWFLRRGSTFRRVRRQQLGGAPPPVCDLVSLQRSPATRVLQFYSMALAGKAKRLRLIWARSHDSFESWTNDSDNAELRFLLRRSILCASSLVFSRFIVALCCVPWLWAKLVDYRHDRTGLPE